MNHPTISIVTPNYNREKYIGASMESALHQSFEDFELIVVDDGSTDRSLEIIRSYKDPRIRVIAQGNQGTCIAKNVGIEAARGQWLRILDSDDMLEPGCLEGQLRDIKSCPSRSIVAGTAVSVNEENQILPMDLYNLVFDGPSDSPVPLSALFASCGNGQLYLYPKEALTEVGGFKREFFRTSEDYDVTIRLYIAGYRFYKFNTPALRVRHHFGPRLTNVRKPDAQMRVYLTAFREYYSALFDGVAPIGGPEDRKALGRHLWSRGRQASREGRPEIAREFYALATQVSGRDAQVGSVLTLALYRLVSPSTAEQVVEALKASAVRLSAIARQHPSEGDQQ